MTNLKPIHVKQKKIALFIICGEIVDGKHKGSVYVHSDWEAGV